MSALRRLGGVCLLGATAYLGSDAVSDALVYSIGKK